METGLLSNEVTQNKKNDSKGGIMNTVYEKHLFNDDLKIAKN